MASACTVDNISIGNRRVTMFSTESLDKLLIGISLELPRYLPRVIFTQSDRNSGGVFSVIVATCRVMVGGNFMSTDVKYST